MRFAHFVVSAALVASSSAARADLVTTDTYSLEYYYANVPGPYSAYGTATTGTLPLTGTVPGGIIDYFNVSVTGSTITFANGLGESVSLGDLPFNGVGLTDTTGTLAATGATLDSASVDPASAVVTVSGNTIYFNFAGDVIQADSVTTFDFGPSAATPEPSSLALLGTGVLGVAGMLRRRIAG